MNNPESKDGYFSISYYPDSDNPVDIGFSPIQGKEDRAPETQYKLKSEIENFIVSIKEIFSVQSDDFRNYLERAYYLAKLGTEGKNIDPVLASRSLEELREEIVISEGPAIRNKLLTIYGWKALTFFSIFGVAGLFLLKVPIPLMPQLSFFLFMVSGAMIGTWLSLGVRTKSFKFEELRILIRDHAGPYIRLSFTGVLTISTGLLMKIGALQISIGDMDSSHVTSDPMVAFTFGVLLGFTEKTLVTTFSEKAKGITE